MTRSPFLDDPRQVAVWPVVAPALLLKTGLLVVVTFFGTICPASLAHAQLGVVGGVYIDAQGMLRDATQLAPDELRERLSAGSATENVSSPIARQSKLRKISLRRLEQTVARSQAAGETVSSDIQCLAGLTAIKYVFIHPEQGDVVLAGPAEGWLQLPSGDLVAATSHRPVLQLDDLVEALRYAFDETRAAGFLGCSIEPTEQGVKAHAAFVRRLSGMDASRIEEVTAGMEQATGPQDIHVYGIDPRSRFALQMIAADYRLKRLALAHDPSPVAKLPSYLDLAEKNISGGPQRQHRWWFVGHYDAVRRTADHLAYEFEGNALIVETAPTRGRNEQNAKELKPTRAASRFAELATKYLAELADKTPAIAELQNLVALALTAAVIRQSIDEPIHADQNKSLAESESISQRYRPRHFLDRQACPTAQLEVPKTTPSLANVRFVKNQFWLFSVSGGVEIDPTRLADESVYRLPKNDSLAGAQKNAVPPTGDDRWWWD